MSAFERLQRWASEHEGSSSVARDAKELVARIAQLEADLSEARRGRDESEAQLRAVRDSYCQVCGGDTSSGSCRACRDLAAAQSALATCAEALESADDMLTRAAIKFGRYFSTYKIMGADDLERDCIVARDMCCDAKALPAVVAAREGGRAS